MKKSQLKKLENIAAKEFNYVGGNSGEDQNYIGRPGEFDFGGDAGNSFAAEYGTGREFTMSFFNDTLVDRVVAICPAYFETLAEMAAEGHDDITAILTDGIIATDGGGDLTATSLNDGKTILGLMRWIKRNPTRIVGFTMQCETRTQFETKISYENLAPFDALGRKSISLTTFRPAGQLGTDKIDANLIKRNQVIDMNDQNLVRLTVKKDATLVVTWFFGAVDNRAANLRAKADLAHQNIKRQHPQLGRGR